MLLAQDRETVNYIDLMDAIFPEFFYKFPGCEDFREMAQERGRYSSENIEPNSGESAYAANLQVFYKLAQDSVWNTNYPCVKQFYNARRNLLRWEDKPISVRLSKEDIFGEIIDGKVDRYFVGDRSILRVTHQIKTFLNGDFLKMEPMVDLKNLNSDGFFKYFKYPVGKELKEEYPMQWQYEVKLNFYKAYLSNDNQRAVAFIGHVSGHSFLSIHYLERIGNKWYTFLLEQF